MDSLIAGSLDITVTINISQEKKNISHEKILKAINLY